MFEPPGSGVTRWFTHPNTPVSTPSGFMPVADHFIERESLLAASLFADHEGTIRPHELYEP